MKIICFECKQEIPDVTVHYNIPSHENKFDTICEPCYLLKNPEKFNPAIHKSFIGRSLWNEVKFTK